MVPLYEESAGFLPRFWIWVFLGLGAFTATMVSMKLRFATLFNKWEVGLVLFGCEVFGLFLAMIVGACLNYPNIESWEVTIAAAFTSFAMGLQNGAAMVMIPNCPPTTAMTGNTVRFFIYGAEALNFYLASKGYVELYPEKAGKPKHYEETMKKYSQELSLKFQLFCSALGPFCTGAVVGVPLAETMGFWSFFVPMIVIIFLLWTLWMARRNALLADPARYGGERIEEHITTISPMFALVESGEKNANNTHDKNSNYTEIDCTGLELPQTSVRTEDTDESPSPDSASGKYSLLVDEQGTTGELTHRTVRRSSSVCEPHEFHG